MKQEQALQGTLQGSSLHVLLMLVSKILTRSGYGDIQLLGRRLKAQKSRVGGCELLCQTNMGHVPIKVIIKVINDGVRTRMLDEMAGAIDRTGSDFGIVVSTEDLSPKVAKNQGKYGKSRVEVIDGTHFASMLKKFKIGIRQDGSPDYAFFGELENQLERVNEFLSHGRFARGS